MTPMFFRSPVHCAIVSDDGFLYACDRGNNRVQVFDVNEVGGACANPDAEPGVCGFVADIHVAPQTASGTSTSAALSTDADQSCLYVADLANGAFYIINRDNHQELDRIGRSGRQVGEFNWVHALAVDSQGNMYTGEVETGQRVQKFVRYGDDGCSDPAARRSGLYSPQPIELGLNEGEISSPLRRRGAHSSIRATVKAAVARAQSENRLASYLRLYC